MILYVHLNDFSIFWLIFRIFSPFSAKFHYFNPQSGKSISILTHFQFIDYNETSLYNVTIDKKGRIFMFIYLFLSILFVSADQVVKMFTVNHFSLHEGMEFIKGIVSILYVRNTGAAWGMFEGKMFFFYLITAVAVGTLLYLMFKEKGKSKLLLTAYSLILAGAVGNFIDRIRLGYVVDMFKFEFIDFPIFNVADICLTIGVIFLFYYVIFKEQSK